MKLLIAFVQREDSQKLLHKLRQANLAVTSFESEGGFLKRKNTTVLMALEDDEVDKAVNTIKENCKTRYEKIDTSFTAGDVENLLAAPTDIPVGGATILVLDVKEKIKI